MLKLVNNINVVSGFLLVEFVTAKDVVKVRLSLGPCPHAKLVSRHIVSVSENHHMMWL